MAYFSSPEHHRHLAWSYLRLDQWLVSWLTYRLLEDAEGVLSKYLPNVVLAVATFYQSLRYLWHLGGISEKRASTVKVRTQTDDIYTCYGDNVIDVVQETLQAEAFLVNEGGYITHTYDAAVFGQSFQLFIA